MIIMIKSKIETPLIEFLEEQNFLIEKIGTNILKVSRNKLDVFVNIDPKNLFFEVDLGNILDYSSKELYKTLLDLNTEILPVSLGLDTSSTNQERLIIVESRETKNLDENEILSVFEAMYIAYVKVSRQLEKFIK